METNQARSEHGTPKDLLQTVAPGESLGVGYKFGSTIPSSHNKDGKQIGTEFTLFTFTNKMII